jgi:hypothetical protein
MNFASKAGAKVIKVLFLPNKTIKLFQIFLFQNPILLYINCISTLVQC